jgi:hypothetical protein
MQTMAHHSVQLTTPPLTHPIFQYMKKLFIYLALAKPALPGQFVLLESSQSKENALKYSCLFRCAARNKSKDF